MPELIAVLFLVPPGLHTGRGIHLHVPGAVTPLGNFLLLGTALNLAWFSQSFPFEDLDDLGHATAGYFAAQKYRLLNDVGRYGFLCGAAFTFGL